MSFIDRVGWKPTQYLTTAAIDRLVRFLTTQVRSLAKDIQSFSSMSVTSWKDLAQSRDAGMILDGLPESEVAKVAEILHRTGTFRRNSVALELGAGTGIQTAELASCGGFRKILAVEPEASNFEALTRSIGQRQLEHIVHCVPCAAGMIDGMTNFNVNLADRLRSGIKQRKPTDLTVRAPINTVRTILHDAQVPAKDIGLVWMDIEGYESMACLSMTLLMQSSVPIFMVFSPDTAHPAQADSFLRFVSTYYHRCVVFDHSGPRMTSISALPVDQPGLRLLLID